MPEPRNAVEAASHADPYPYYRRLRQQQPLFFDAALGLWVASSYAAVDEAFHHSALRVRPPAQPVPQALAGGAAGEVFAQLVRMTDGAFHAEHKPQVARSAMRWTAEAIAAASRETAARLKPRLDADAFVTALPVQAMARLLGVPDALLQATSDQVHAFTLGIAAGATVEQVMLAHVAAAALMAQGAALGLAPAQAANRIALMQQSVDATAGLIGLTAGLLRDRPVLRARMADGDSARALVSEAARWDAPVQNTRRFAAADLELQGQKIRESEGVLLVLASANRDPALNPQPDTFDPARASRRSTTFGAGVHQCPGELLAVAIAAACADDAGYFGPATGYRPLPNARVPVFGQAGPAR